MVEIPCVTDERRLWDVEASETEHRTAEWICNRRCPVRDACAKDATKRTEGMIAGLMRDARGRSFTVEDWHKTHGQSGAVRTWDEQKLPTESADERRCAGPGCNEVFPVERLRSNRRFCTGKCRNAARQRTRAEAHAS